MRFTNDIDYTVVKQFVYHQEDAPDWFLDKMNGGAVVNVRGSSGSTTLLRTIFGFLPIKAGDTIGLTDTNGMVIIRKE